MIEGIRAVSLPVDDLQAATEWYEAVLGRRGLLDHDNGTVSFVIKDFELVLTGPNTACPALAFHWAGDDMTAHVKHLVGLGGTTLSGPMRRDDGTWHAALRDPFGKTLGLIERDDRMLMKARSQRTWERVALRKVRDTLDGLDAGGEERKNRRIFWGALATIALGCALLLWVITLAMADRSGALPLKPTFSGAATSASAGR